MKTSCLRFLDRLQLIVDDCIPRHVIRALVVVLEDARSDLRPVVLLLPVGKRSRAEPEFPGALGELLHAAAEAFHIRLMPFTALGMLIHLVCLEPFPGHEFRQVTVRYDIEALADLVMDQHWQGALQETVSLEDAVF